MSLFSLDIAQWTTEVWWDLKVVNVFWVLAEKAAVPSLMKYFATIAHQIWRAKKIYITITIFLILVLKWVLQVLFRPSVLNHRISYIIKEKIVLRNEMTMMKLKEWIRTYKTHHHYRHDVVVLNCVYAPPHFPFLLRFYWLYPTIFIVIASQPVACPRALNHDIARADRPSTQEKKNAIFLRQW